MSNLSTIEHSDCSMAATVPSTGEDISSKDTPNIIHQLRQAHPSKEFAILDSGATAHFIVQGANVLNQKTTSHPLRIKLPDGSFITSTHTCNLNIPWLPVSMTEAHIVPGLTHSSLVATKKFCDAGCKVLFDANVCHIFHNGKLVLTGTRCTTTGLWIIPLNPSTPHNTVGPPPHLTPPPPQHMAYNVYTLPFKQQQLKYMNQAFFSPPVHTLIKAINNAQLVGVPFMKPDLIRKYLVPSPATSKGRMKCPRTGIRSTRSIPPPPDNPTRASLPIPTQGTNTTHVIPLKPIGDSSCNVFCYATLADKHTGTMYTDATGALPAVSLDGNQYYFIAYAYDPNYVFAIPIHNLRDETILKAFDEVFQELKTKGLKPTFNVTDNQAAQSIKTYLTNVQTKWQFVEPNNHQVNAAERQFKLIKTTSSVVCALQTRIGHLQLWDTLTQQALITLNLLRTSRIDPTKSAYHQLHGHRYDWNAHPLSPPGTKAIIYESPNTRTSWGPRGLDAWYCGPSLDHYRNAKFYVPATKAYGISGSYDLFPQHCILPTFTPDQHVQEFLHKVAKALDKVTTNQHQTISTDTTSEGETIPTPPPTSTDDMTFQRVSNAPEVTTTTTPTDPSTVKHTPRIHKRVTRGNTPRQLPAIINPEHLTKPTRKSPHLREHDDEPILTIREPSSSRIPLHSPHLIAFRATDPQHTWVPNSFISSSPIEHTSPYDVDIENFCAGVQHPVTKETITKYKTLIKLPGMNEIWTTAFGKEFGNLAQGDLKTGEKGTNTLFVMSHDEIANIPQGRTVTYGRIVIDFRPQKTDPNRVRITAGGNLIKEYPGELTTRTADLTTSKILWNSVLSTKGARFMGIDIKSFSSQPHWIDMNT
eukprot:CCRYP_000851-RA/>CCRYP_000851-RA protein AED:0.26 eAED:0.15 QI:0/0/0/1/0/0.33/3/0/868